MGTDAAPAPRPPATRRAAGVVLIQGISSLSTVIMMVLLAITLPRDAFDAYAVWATSAQLLLGVAQAVGTDRVLIGRRAAREGADAAYVLALVVGGPQLVLAWALGEPALAICAVPVAVGVVYDFHRVVGCFDRPRTFLARDAVVLIVQVLAVVTTHAVAGSTPWIVIAWWASATPFWLAWSSIDGLPLRRGARVIRHDARESAPLALDAILSSIPVFVALALANAQGSEGNASAARMALTILGPVTVLALASRRLVFARVAAGPLGPRFAGLWVLVVATALFVCAGLLALTRTPLYPWLLPGFGALSWLAIVGFAANHAAVISSYLPAALLRATGRARAVGVARLTATAASAVALVALMPFSDPADVGWFIGIGSAINSAVLYLAVTRAGRRRLEPARPIA